MSDHEHGANTKANTETGTETSAEGIAIIGLAGRFPGARDIEAFWRNLRDGVESITFFTPEQLQEAGLDPAILEQPNFVAANGMLEDVDHFDAAFFGYTPREAQLIDPQQRLFLECAQHTLEHAGYDPARFDGRIGLFGGAGANYYLLGNLVNNRALIEEIGVLQILLANEGDYLCSRVSYKLDLRGPVALVQSACSTALVSIHMACQSLLTGECEMALAGGVSIGLPQDQGYFYTEGGILSRDGHCRSFDASSTGTVNGNGVGMVALKRLEDALEDGDVVHAVLLGSAINNDGASKVGFTAPSVECQSEVVGEALGVTGVDAETIAYIETHGSGTALGDPIEAQALIDAYADHAEATGYCGIGSVKSNIGHTNAAAGVAGMIKVVQGLKHGEIPPSLHFEQLNPEIDFTDTPFFVNAELRPWPRLKDQPRRAAISSFGLGGTNAHAIVQEAPAVEPSGPSRGHQLVLVSARSEAALDTATRNLADHLQAHPELKLADAAFTLQLGRAEMEMRRAVVVRDDGGDTGRSDAGKKAAIEALRAEPVATKVDKDTRPVVFLLPGLGDHYVQLGRRLYEDEPTFREDFDACAEGLLEPLGVDIRDILYPGDAPPEPTDEEAAAGTDFKALLRRGGGEVDEATARLNRTVHAQPALFAVEYALARLLMEWGLEPSSLIGYSLGEYVAACLAGVLELDDALALVAKRARLIDGLPEGAMLAVPLPESELVPKLKQHPDLDLCATNGPNLSVAGGPVPAVDALEKDLQEAGVTCIRLSTTHAFHTRMMAPVAEALTELVSGFELQTPEIPVLSNVTGTWLSDADATDPAYWARHLCGTVRFAESLSELLEDARRLLIELGPGNALGTLIKQHPSVKAEQVVISALRHQSERRSDVAYLLRALGHAWLAGARIDWHGFYAHESRHRVVLPAYPFERRRYWIDPNPAESSATGKRGRAGSGGGQVGVAEMRKGKAPLSEWFYLPSWRQTPTRLPADGRAPEDAMETGRWLIFLEADSDQHGIGGDILRRLRAAGHDAIGVRAGDAYAAASEGGAESDGIFTVRPSERGDYLSLLRQLKEDGELPSRILHLWSLTQDRPSFDAAQAHGLHSLMALVQAYADIDAGAPLRLGVVGNRLQDVAGGEGVEAEKAPLVGACRVIPQELPHAWAAAIDVVLPPPEGQNRRRRLVDQLLAEMTVAPTSADAAWSTPVIALRGPHRWVQDFEPVRLLPASGKAASGKATSGKAGSSDQPPRLRQGGSYLITDGTSELGQELTEFLLRRFDAQVTAVLPPGWDAGSDEGVEAQAGEAQQAMAVALQERHARARTRLDGLAKEFPSLVLEHHDVTDVAAVRQLVDGVRQRQGDLHGVLHTATNFSGGLIQVKTTADLTAVHGAVARGALALEEVLSGDTAGTAIPDFVLLSSTSTAVTGGLGQLDLCAAGSVLSALADRRAAAGDSHWLTVGWGSFAWDQWGLPGMMANPELQKQVRENLEAYGVTASESVDVFQRALASRQPRLVVSTQDLHTVIANTTAVTAESLLEQVSRTTELHPRGELSVPYEAPTDDVEAKLAVIWQRLFGIDKVGIHDNFFELGGYSLLGIQMVTQVRQTFDFEIQITELFDTPTVAGLAGRIRGDETEPELDEDDMADLLSQVEGMSPEDMAALLAESDG